MASPEADFQKSVIKLAKLQNWVVAHFIPAQVRAGVWVTPFQADGRGFPDLVLVRERVVFAELKTKRGRLSDHQRQWRELLLAAGAEVYVWRPDDWDQILEVLGGKNHPGDVARSGAVPDPIPIGVRDPLLSETPDRKGSRRRPRQ